jgi:hypothetical protein
MKNKKLHGTGAPRNPAAGDPKWRYEQESEASILGSNFAFAIAAIATGNKDKLLGTVQQPKSAPAFRKIFWEEPQYNPSLNHGSTLAGYNAYLLEEEKHWKKTGAEFERKPREFGRVKSGGGPRKPEEFPYVFEKPHVAYERSGEVRPFSRVKKLASNVRMEQVKIQRNFNRR